MIGCLSYQDLLIVPGEPINWKPIPVSGIIIIINNLACCTSVTIRRHWSTEGATR